MKPYYELFTDEHRGLQAKLLWTLFYKFTAIISIEIIHPSIIVNCLSFTEHKLFYEFTEFSKLYPPKLLTLPQSFSYWTCFSTSSQNFLNYIHQNYNTRFYTSSQHFLNYIHRNYPLFYNREPSQIISIEIIHSFTIVNRPKLYPSKLSSLPQSWTVLNYIHRNY